MEVEEIDLKKAQSLGSIRKQKKAKKSVVEELEKASEILSLNIDNQKHLSADDIRFCTKMIKKRGEDFKVIFKKFKELKIFLYP